MLNVLLMVGRSWCSCASATSRVASFIASFSLLSLLLVSSSCHRLFASCFSLFRQLERHACKSASERNEFASHTRVYRLARATFVFLLFFLYFLKGKWIVLLFIKFSFLTYTYIFEFNAFDKFLHEIISIMVHIK